MYVAEAVFSLGPFLAYETRPPACPYYKSVYYIKHHPLSSVQYMLNTDLCLCQPRPLFIVTLHEVGVTVHDRYVQSTNSGGK